MDIFEARKGDLRQKLAMELRPDFGVENVKFTWLPTYLRDLEARKEIEELEAQIVKTEKLPRDKGELRKAFAETLASEKAGGMVRLKEHIKAAQFPGKPVFPIIHGNWVILQAFLNFDLAEEEIDRLFEDLEEGVAQKEKDRQIAEFRRKIDGLHKMIEEELSPQYRWFHNGGGYPIRYPKGCRWTHYVNVWKEVSSRYLEPVTIEGYKLETANEKEAYFSLKLDKVPKLTPLREGEDRCRR